MQAVILAGGAGTRLRPLTYEIPKPMIDVNGKPFLQYIVEWFKKYGVSDFVFCVGYLADKFKEYFGDGSKLGVRIRYSIEEQFLGTAGAVKLAEDLLEEEFFVANGDTFLPVDIDDVREQFKKSKKAGLMVVYDNKEKAAENNITVDENGLVSAYGKKEQLKKGDQLININSDKSANYQFVDAGLYMFKKDLFKTMEKDKFVSLEADVYPELIKSKQLFAYKTSIRYYDLGTQDRLELIRRVFK